MITDDMLMLALREEAERRQAWFAMMIKKHPERAQAISYGFLGDAISYADTFGIDVERFLQGLRARFSKPEVIERPKGEQS